MSRQESLFNPIVGLQRHHDLAFIRGLPHNQTMPDSHTDHYSGPGPSSSPSREAPDRASLAILDTLWAVVFSPSTAFAAITYRRPLIWALLVAIAVALMGGFVLVPNPPELAEVILGLEKGTLPAAPVFAFWVAFFVLVVALQVLVVHLLALALRGKGSYAGAFSGICFAYFPGLLAAPLAWLRAGLDSLAGNVLYSVVFTILCFWIAALAIVTAKHNYGLSMSRAAVACLFTALLLVVLPPLIVIIFMFMA